MVSMLLLTTMQRSEHISFIAPSLNIPLSAKYIFMPILSLNTTIFGFSAQANSSNHLSR